MQSSPKLIVGIGASAGGLTAFRSFLANTPADTGSAYVIVQHLAPDHESILVELLGSKSAMPVIRATGGLAVKPNCVFVIPPDATLTIKDQVLHLATPAPPREHRRPIDTFFISLAEDCGERGVGIVLSGVGSDGSNGVRAIKEHGGLTLAQAEFDHHVMCGMPSSAVSTGLVDHVLEVADMPGRLIEHADLMAKVATIKDGNGQRGEIEKHLPEITALLRAHSEHDFSGYKKATLVRRLQRRMHVLQVAEASAYVQRLRVARGESEALFRELLIGVTRFFRDDAAFEALKTSALAPILAARPESEPVRVWVAGCSTGEEVYSIAILFKEALQDAGRRAEVTIFGTDIDSSAIDVARKGRYSLTASGLSPERLKAWFAIDGDECFLIPAIRDMCVFSTHSLVKDPPFSRLDFISCRNVMIYLDEALQDRVMRTFHYALAPRGFLFLGAAESVTRHARMFDAVDKKNRILQRRDYTRAGELPTLRPPKLAAAQPTLAFSALRDQRDEQIDRAIGRVMKHFQPAYFVLDRNHDVARFSGAETGPYLEPSHGTASLNFFSILHKTLRPAVRAAVNRAQTTGLRVVNATLSLRNNDQTRMLTLMVEPVGGDDPRGSGTCIVAFCETAAVAPDTVSPACSADAGMQLIERELAAVRAQLQAAVDELEMRMDDMRTTTEAFQAVNEELQSSNEELETSKEEMQSINEELQTINSELNNKNDLLTRLNSDMQNLLESTQIATVFLDDNLAIKHFTPTLTELFPLRDSDRGRSLEQIVSGLDYSDLADDVRKVRLDGMVIERDLFLKDRNRSFVMRIRPYRQFSGETDGVVITFVDITARKLVDANMRQNNMRLAEQADQLLQMAEIVASADDAIVSKNMLGLITSWNKGAQKLYGYTPEEMIGKHSAVLIPPGQLDDDAAQLVRIFSNEVVEHYETVCRAKDGRLIDVSMTVSPVYNVNGEVVGTARIARDITPRKEADARQALLSRELQHRTQNLLGVIQSLAHRTLVTGRPIGESREVFVARLHALGRSNALHMTGGWKGAHINSVIKTSLEPFAERYSVDGPDIILNPQATQGFSLILHELCTNALKYGAFSTREGRVGIKWSVEHRESEPQLKFEWQERGGPTVVAPECESFGTALLRQAITGRDAAELDYASDGLVYRLSADLATVAAA